MFKVVSQLNKPPKKLITPSQILCYQEKTTGIPNPVYSTAFTVKVNQINCVIYLRLNFTGDVGWAQLLTVMLELTEKVWSWIYTQQVAIMVKSVKVPKNNCQALIYFIIYYFISSYEKICQISIKLSIKDFNCDFSNHMALLMHLNFGFQSLLLKTY